MAPPEVRQTPAIPLLEWHPARQPQTAGVDKFVVRSGHDTATFLGAGAFTGTDGREVRWDEGLHQLQVDVHGDGRLVDVGDIAVDGATLATLTAHNLLFV